MFKHHIVDCELQILWVQATSTPQIAIHTPKAFDWLL